jgi:diguanylate cyclase (GGDEF)-like protein
MDHQDWQARTRKLSSQVEAIANRDLQLWLFAFVVVLILASGILVVGFSHVAWTGVPRSSLELASALVLLIILFAGYVFYKRHSYSQAREELVRDIIYSEKLHSLSLFDPLTQTFNLGYLDQVLPREINRANRQGCTITFMMVGIAKWAKAVEKKGELLGDQMLVEAAQLLKSTFRGADIVLRYDVSRFLVIMPETAEPQAGCAMQRMLERVDSWNLESRAPFELDLDIGMATYSPGADPNAVLRLAEERLQSGRSLARTDKPFPDLASSALSAACGTARRAW